ncbi:hypothetical protein A2U01_0047815, partial [Trifolium medium]|nr:hypothetical protein [Trifolium medium]
ELVYFASKETLKKVALSWLETMTITADKVAEKAKNLNKRWHILLVLAMDFSKLVQTMNLCSMKS